MKTQIRGQTFDLRSERTVFWEEKKILFCADLHWGKDLAFHQHGIPIPEGTLNKDLERLSAELKQTGATKLLILGDLVHSKRVVTDELAAKIERWRLTHKELLIEVILGNHDRGLEVPKAWGMLVHKSEIIIDEFMFSHDDVESDFHFVWSGHVHPVIHLRSPTDSLRLPCFVIEERNGLLPAFSLFTGGYEVALNAKRCIYAVADNQVLPI